MRRLVGAFGEMGAGIFELAGERFSRDREGLRDHQGRLRDLAGETGQPVTWPLKA